MPQPQISTTVRSFRRDALRAGLAAAGRLSPDFAARLGARLFFTPPRPRVPGRETDALADGDRFTVALRRGRVAAWRFGGGPPVLLVHGWGGRGGQLLPFVPALRAAGLSAVVFDAPAHGASRGRTASIADFAEAIQAVAARVHAVGAVAHSMGATAVARALAAGGLSLEAAVFVAAARAPGAWFDRFCDELALTGRVRGALHDGLVRRVGVAPDALDVARQAPAQRVPLLVAHDRDDREIPFADAEAIAAAWPGARLLATAGLGHRRILRDARLVSAVTGFLQDALPRCACGRLAPARGRSCAGCALAEHLADREGRAPLRATGA